MFRHFASVLVVVCASILATGDLLAAELIGVRFGPDRAKTRIVVDMKGGAEYALSGDETGAGRLIVDFSGLSIGETDKSPVAGKGHIAQFQFLSRANGDVRAMFAFKNTAKVKEVFLLEPKGAVTKYRLVIDLESADKAAFLASLPSRYPDLGAVIEKATAGGAEPGVFTPAASKQKEVDASPLVQPPLPKRVIVVDAGHGGIDPGSQGQGGTLEKNVTMKAALELEKILKATGRYDVVLTRTSNDDKRVLSSQREELARREKLAREAQADLFISLHADAIGQKALRGGSVYTLSQQGSKRSAKIAKTAGNYVVYDLDAAQYGEGVSDILFDLAQSATGAASTRFAEILVKKLTGQTEMLNRSHRTADLRVLLAPDVPAVLYEMAFISNAKDEANLNSSAWRKRSMEAVASAIDAYFEEYGGARLASNAAPDTN